MNNEIFGDFKEQTDKFLAPAREWNKLTVAHIEKLAGLQIASLQEYAELGLGQFRVAASMNDASDVQDYVRSQSEFAKTIGEKLLADSRACAELGKEFTESAQKIARESVSSVTAKAA